MRCEKPSSLSAEIRLTFPPQTGFGHERLQFKNWPPANYAQFVAPSV